MNTERLSTLTVSYRESIGLMDAARYLACASIARSPEPAAALFLSKYPRTVAAPIVRKALDDGSLVRKAMIGSTTDPAWAGALLPPTILDPLILRMQAETVLRRAGFLAVPFNVPAPTLTAPSAMVWVPQNSPKPVSKFTFASNRLLPMKGAEIIVVSDELIRSVGTGGEALLTALLIRKTADFVDRQLLDPAVAAVADKNPASITNGVAPIAVVAGDVQATAMAVVAALFEQRPSTRRAALILGPGVAAALAGTGLHPQLLAPEGRAFGLTAVSTPGAAGLIVAVDLDGVAYADDGAEVDISQQAAIVFDNGAGAMVQDLWQLDLHGFRVDRFVNWIAEPNAVAWATFAPAGLRTKAAGK